MATFFQWRSHAIAGDLPRITWVCGEQSILIEELIDIAKRATQASSMSYLSIDASDVSVGEVRAAIDQHILSQKEKRLIVIRSAQELDYAVFQEWIGNKNRANAYLILVSDDKELPVLKGNAEVTTFFNTYGVYKVKCFFPNEEDLLSWVQLKAYRQGDEVVRRIIERCGDSLKAMSDLAVKLNVIGEDLSAEHVDALCEDHPSGTFEISLLAFRKVEAYQLSDNLKLSKVLGSLDQKLGALETMYLAAKAKKSGKETAADLGNQTFLYPMLRHVAQLYGPTEIQRRRMLLGLLEPYYRYGDCAGVIESLISMW